MDNFEDFIGKKVTNIEVNENKIVISFSKERIEIQGGQSSNVQPMPVLLINRVQQ